jgi:hypothetical protein
MKARTLLLTLLVCLFAVAMYAADNPNMGTWKLNEAKSKFPAGAAKNSTVVYSATDNGNIKVTTDGVDGKNQPAHTEWVGKFDGKDYPVTGGESGATRSYKMVNDHTTDISGKVNGKENLHGKIEVAKDGKSRTVDIESTAPDGKKMKSKAVYDKQ